MMITINCPKCGADSKLSLVQQVYAGPHKCWKCRELYNIRIENNEVTYMEPMSDAELEAYQRQEEERERSRHMGE